MLLSNLFKTVKLANVSKSQLRSRLTCEYLEGRDVPSTAVEQVSFTLPNGQVLAADVTYDTSQVTNAPTQQITLSNLSLQVNGQAYAQSDGDLNGTAVADFQNGNFVGVEFDLQQTATGYSNISVVDGNANTVAVGSGTQAQVPVNYYGDTIPQKAAAIIDFTPLAGQPNKVTMTLVLTASDGTNTPVNVTIPANANAATIAKLVYQAIPQSSLVYKGNGLYVATAGWTTVLDGSTIEIYSARAKSGKYGNDFGPAPAESPIKTIDPEVTGTKAEPKVYITNANVGTPLTAELTFGPNGIDGTATVQATTTFDLNIDGTDVLVTEAAGTSFTQVENNLYTTAVSMGLVGISTSGSSLLISQNFSGQPISTVSITASTQTGSPESFIDTTVSYLPQNANG